MLDSKKELVLFTLFFPFSKDGIYYDSYIADEIAILSNSFKKIHIVSGTKETIIENSLPQNINYTSYIPVLSFKEKISSFKFICKRNFYTEIREILSKSSVSNYLKNIKLLFSSYGISKKYSQFLNDYIDKNIPQDTNVYLYTYWMFEYAYAISTLRKNKYSIKSFSRAHSLDIYLDRTKWNYQPLKQSIINSIDKVFVVSKAGEKYLYSNYSIRLKDENKIIINKLGIPDYLDRTQSPSYNNKFTIVSNSWLQPLKRVDLLIKVLSEINFELDWYHIGDDYGTGYVSVIDKLNIELLSTKKNIHVHFLGRLNKEEIITFYNTKYVNVLVNLSTTEGIPVSMMEAICFGIPVIATNVGGVKEIVKDQLNGFLLPENPSIKEVATSIDKLMNMPAEDYDKLRQNARNVWESEYSATKNYKMLLEHINSL